MLKKKQLKIVDQFSKSGTTCKKSSIKKNIDQKKTKIAICITCGEQSEIHAGMVKHGDGLAKNGYSIEKMRKIEENFTKMAKKNNMDINTEWIFHKDYLTEKEKKDTEDAAVLVIRNGAQILLKNKEKILGVKTSKNLFEEQLTYEWDKKYWDNRRQKVLNKRARHNVCYGEEGKRANYEKKDGTIIAYDNVPLLYMCKQGLEECCEEKKFEAEGNKYYDVLKTYIGFHGDGERKKVVAISLSHEDVVREIQWVWFKKSKPIGKRIKIKLRNGDIYIMSEKASGFDWKKKVKVIEKDGKYVKVDLKTLRHAAAIPGSKCFKIANFEN